MTRRSLTRVAVAALLAAAAAAPMAAQAQNEDHLHVGLVNMSNRPFVFHLSDTATFSRWARMTIAAGARDSVGCGRDDYCYLRYTVFGTTRRIIVGPGYKYLFTRGPQGWQLYAVRD